MVRCCEERWDQLQTKCNVGQTWPSENTRQGRFCSGAFLSRPGANGLTHYRLNCYQTSLDRLRFPAFNSAGGGGSAVILVLGLLFQKYSLTIEWSGDTAVPATGPLAPLHPGSPLLQRINLIMMKNPDQSFQYFFSAVCANEWSVVSTY